MDLKTAFELYFFAVCGDFISGVMASAKEGRLKSRTCSNGMFRSMGEIFTLIIGVVVACYMPELHEIILVFTLGFLFKEGLSICENLVRLDVWIPDSLIKFLDVGKQKVNEGEVTNGSKINSTNQ